MGRNFAARARPGVPPPPGSPGAQGLGCSCPFEKNQNLTGPFNNVWLVAAHCPVHGWDANPDPGVQGQATIIQAIAEAFPALRQRFRVKDLWLSRSVARGVVRQASAIKLLVDFEVSVDVGVSAPCDLQDALEAILGVKVNLGCLKDLEPESNDTGARDMIQIPERP